MEVASALLDASNNKGSKSPCDNNSSSSWLGGWLHSRFTLVYIFEWFVVCIKIFLFLRNYFRSHQEPCRRPGGGQGSDEGLGLRKSRRQICQEAEEALAGGTNKANIFMSF